MLQTKLQNFEFFQEINLKKVIIKLENLRQGAVNDHQFSYLLLNFSKILFRFYHFPNVHQIVIILFYTLASRIKQYFKNKIQLIKLKVLIETHKVFEDCNSAISTSVDLFGTLPIQSKHQASKTCSPPFSVKQKIMKEIRHFEQIQHTLNFLHENNEHFLHALPSQEMHKSLNRLFT